MAKLKPIQRIRVDIREGDIVRLFGNYDNGKPLEAVGYVGWRGFLSDIDRVQFRIHPSSGPHAYASEVFSLDLRTKELWRYSKGTGDIPRGKIENYEVLRRAKR